MGGTYENQQDLEDKSNYETIKQIKPSTDKIQKIKATMRLY